MSFGHRAGVLLQIALLHFSAAESSTMTQQHCGFRKHAVNNASHLLSFGSSTAARLLSAAYAKMGIMHVIIIIMLFLIYRLIGSWLLHFIATAGFSLITDLIWNAKQFASSKSLHHAGLHFIWTWEYCLTELSNTWCYRKWLCGAFNFRGGSQIK